MKANEEHLIEVAEQAIQQLSAALADPSRDVLGDAVVQDSLAKLLERTAKVHQLAEKMHALVAGKLFRQCDAALGVQAMHARYGHRNASSLVADLCKTTLAEADRLVHNGRMLQTLNAVAEAEEFGLPLDEETQKASGSLPLAQALNEGTLTPAQAHEIHKALENTPLSVDDRLKLTSELVETGVDLEINSLKRYAQKRVLAHSTKSPLELEEELRSRRYISIGTIQDGLYPIRGMLDAESAALVKAVFDDATNPNRPNFLEPARLVRENRSSRNTSSRNTRIGLGEPGNLAPEQRVSGQRTPDQRTPDQRRVDRLVEVLQTGINADPNHIFSNKPAVRVIIRAEDLANAHGRAWFEGVEVPMSKHLANRMICNSGIQTAVVDGRGVVLSLGREVRTFSPQQKNALVIRDGGCMWPECDRPPNWCEAHHIVEWENGGRTDLENGILLCRRHHMELHNQQYRIVPPSRRSGEDDVALFWLEPPPEHPKQHGPIPLPTKAPWFERKKSAETAPAVLVSG